MQGAFPGASSSTRRRPAPARTSSRASSRSSTTDGHDLQLPPVGSTVTGAVAPLDNTTRTSSSTSRASSSRRRRSLLLGVPYYGFDWPVTATSRTPPSSGQDDLRRRRERHLHRGARLPCRPSRGRPPVRRVRGQRFFIYRDRPRRPIARSTSRTSAASPPSTTTRSSPAWPASGSGPSTTTAATPSCGTSSGRSSTPRSTRSPAARRHATSPRDPATSRWSSTTRAATPAPCRSRHLALDDPRREGRIVASDAGDRDDLSGQGDRPRDHGRDRSRAELPAGTYRSAPGSSPEANRRSPTSDSASRTERRRPD